MQTKGTGRGKGTRGLGVDLIKLNSRIRESLRALEFVERAGGVKRIKTALKLIRVMERFVKSGGRFKKHFKRKNKRAAKV